MKSASDFKSILGSPFRSNEESQVREIGNSWGVELPADFCEISGAYGDAAFSEFILLCGMRGLAEYSALMGPMLEKSLTVPHLILPTAGGALLWGNTVEGDQLFLVPQSGGKWTVSAFRRQWGDWYASDMEFGDWFHAALTGLVATDWLPQWGDLPHSHELDE